MIKKIRLLLVEDNRLLREGITSLLGPHHDIQVEASFGTNEVITQKMVSFKPSVLLVDLGLRNQNSLEFVKYARLHFGSAKVIVMDLLPTGQDVLQFVRAGVSGFILKEATIEDFLSTIRSVARGEQVLPTGLTNSLFSEIIENAIKETNGNPKKLLASVRMTRRERQIIELVSEGMSNKEIAQELHLSTYTVKSHVHNILEKLAIHTRVQIARYAHTTENFNSISGLVSLIEE